MITDKQRLAILLVVCAALGSTAWAAPSATAQSAPNLSFDFVRVTDADGSVYTVGIDLNGSGQYPQTVDARLSHGGSLLDTYQLGHIPNNTLSWDFVGGEPSEPGTYEVCLDSAADGSWSAGHLCQTFVVPHRQGASAAGSACRNVHTRFITAKHVRASQGLGCQLARHVLKRYFRRVVKTGQVQGGCAQKRFGDGCVIASFRCFTKRNPNVNKGRCRDGQRLIRFREIDSASSKVRGKAAGPHSAS